MGSVKCQYVRHTFFGSCNACRQRLIQRAPFKISGSLFLRLLRVPLAQTERRRQTHHPGLSIVDGAPGSQMRDALSLTLIPDPDFALEGCARLRLRSWVPASKPLTRLPPPVLSTVRLNPLTLMHCPRNARARVPESGMP